MTENDTIARLTRERDEAREGRDRARRDYEGACHLVAKMHHAATGAVTGPARGVVEDVAGVRARLLAAESRAERLDAALREIAYMCATGYYANGGDYASEAKRIARAALGEEGK